MFAPCCLAAIMYLLTGGPSAGKTSIIDELEKQGEPVVHESATDWIANKLHMGVHEFWKEELMEYEILQLQMAREEPFLNADGRVFIDRGLFDHYAFAMQFHLAGTKALSLVNEALADIDLTKRYAAIFYVTPYQGKLHVTHTEIRRDSTREAMEQQAALYAIYSRHKNFILVPGCMTPAERAAFILDKVKTLE